MISLLHNTESSIINVVNETLEDEGLIVLLSRINEARKLRREVIIRLDNEKNREKLISFQFHRLGVKIEPLA